MKKIVIAGATGYLGQYLIKEAKKQGYWVRALTRSENSLSHLSDYIDDIVVCEVTKPDSLQGAFNDIDYVISTVGITKQKDGLTYMDVDYQGNRNLLDEAKNEQVTKFIYVSVFNADKMKVLKAIQAKLKFEDDLKNSGINYTVIRPNGFFSDMLEYLKMAKKGRGYVFGSGEQKINPIHGEDLAKVCLEGINSQENTVNIGGPEIFTHNELLQVAFNVVNKKTKISSIPMWIRNMLLSLARTILSVKTYGPLEFFMTVLATDMVAPVYGNRHLKQFYIQNKEELIS